MKSVILLLFLLVIISCGKEEQPDIVSEIVSELTVESSVTHSSIVFTTNKEWAVFVSFPQGNDSWCSVSPSKGSAGEVEINIIATTENSGNEDRSATITIKTGKTVKTVTFTQKQKSVVRTVHVGIRGTLKKLLGIYYKETEELTISGEIHGDDIQTIREMENLHYLDMLDVSIVVGGSFVLDDGQSYSTKTNAIPERMLEGYRNIKTVVLPRDITAIGNWTFAYCYDLTSITLPNSVTSIGEYAFANCHSLTSITLPNSVASIGKYAFADCRGLTSITLSNSVTSIGEHAFDNCRSLTSISIPNSVISIGKYAFEDCRSLISIVLSNGITSIGEYAFYNCYSLTSITLPNGVTSVGEGTFGFCYYLTAVILPESVTSIEEYAFYQCYYLTSITLPDGVSSIGDNAFAKTSLNSIILPNSVTSIGYGAFFQCYELTSITIGSGIKNIQTSVFDACWNIQEIYIKATTPPQMQSDIPNQSAVKLYVPKGSKEIYQNNESWSGFKEYIEVDYGIRESYLWIN